MLLLLCKEGDIIVEYKNNDFIKFNEFEKYKYLGLVYPYMCIFINNLRSTEPNILMLSLDSVGRLQYKYNQYHIERSNKLKIEKIGYLLDNVEEVIIQIKKDLNSNDLLISSLACMAMITAQTGIRIGKDIHMKNYDSIGLSTLQRQHVNIKKDLVTFEFIGKKQVHHVYNIDDVRLIRILNKLYNNTKHKNDFIFNVDDKKITYIDFNIYLKTLFKNKQVTGKDFRTLLANIVFIEHFILNMNTMKLEVNLKKSVEFVASKLHNTKAVSKKSYIFNTLFNFLNSGDISKISKMSPIVALKYIFKKTR